MVSPVVNLHTTKQFEATRAASGKAMRHVWCSRDRRVAFRIQSWHCRTLSLGKCVILIRLQHWMVVLHIAISFNQRENHGFTIMGCALFQRTEVILAFLAPTECATFIQLRYPPGYSFPEFDIDCSRIFRWLGNFIRNNP
jgi:hypothetical protein